MNIGAVVLSAYLKPRPDRQAAGEELARQLALNLVGVERRPARVAEASRRAWKTLMAAPGITHGMVIQDDAILTPGFRTNLQYAVAENPDNFIALYYVRRSVVSKAQEQGKSWIVTKGGVWGQAIVAPIGLAQEFIQWEQRYVLPSYPHDDGRLSLWAALTDRWIWVTVPSLVDHDVSIKSSLGHSAHIGSGGLVSDGAMIDWSRGIEDPVEDKVLSFGARSQVEYDRIKGLGV